MTSTSPSVVKAAFDLTAACLTSRGKVREDNEDAIAFHPEHGLFAVADGVGTMGFGGQTAETVAALIPSMAGAVQREVPMDVLPEDLGRLFVTRISELSDNIAENGNMGHSDVFGTTLIVSWFVEKRALVTCIGDSRAYILGAANGLLRQISNDHSIVQLLLEQGEITAAEVGSHPARGQLTRYVGMPPPALPELFVEPVSTGDKILLCSDGLNDMVPDIRIAQIMTGGDGPHAICRALIEAANDAGGKDNISVVVVLIGNMREGKR